jgi:phytoene desaturase
MNKKTALIIGSGFGGLGSAALLAKAGWDVTVLEKNEMVGGRASIFSASPNKKGVYTRDKKPSNNADSFRFDMGPSWYLMPDVFEHFFSLFGEDVHKHLDLKKLSPSYRIFYKEENKHVDIFSDLKKDLPTIEAIETGAAEQLERYLDQAGYQYDVAKDRFMYKNYDSWRDFLTREMATEGRKLSVFKTMDKYVKGYFKTDQLQKIMQYPLVFLGSSPYNTPAIYNIMSHIDFNMGVFYPQGGIYKISEALANIAQKHGATLKVKSSVKQILVRNGEAEGVVLENGKTLKADIVISNADIHHTETKLLAPEHRQYSEKYWNTRTLAPSALIMYLGVKKKYPSLKHHNLLFSKDWKKNFAEIFDTPQWPTDPSLYVCAPSKTDTSVAPKGHENLFVLVPIAPNLTYTQKKLEKYADSVMQTMETEMDMEGLRESIVYKELFSVKDFFSRYNSQGGTALGLAHTLKQTAIFRPNNISKKVKNLYYVGAGTNPGIGMPITLISAELMYKRLTGDTTSGPLNKL